MKNVQIKVKLENGLEKIWINLQDKYKKMSKDDIIELALNNLVKAEDTDFLLEEVFDDLDSRTVGMTEDEFAKWWNKNRVNS